MMIYLKTDWSSLYTQTIHCHNQKPVKFLIWTWKNSCTRFSSRCCCCSRLCNADHCQNFIDYHTRACSWNWVWEIQRIELYTSLRNWWITNDIFCNRFSESWAWNRIYTNRTNQISTAQIYKKNSWKSKLLELAGNWTRGVCNKALNLQQMFAQKSRWNKTASSDRFKDCTRWGIHKRKWDFIQHNRLRVCSRFDSRRFEALHARTSAAIVMERQGMRVGPRSRVSRILGFATCQAVSWTIFTVEEKIVCPIPSVP